MSVLHETNHWRRPGARFHGSVSVCVSVWFAQELANAAVTLHSHILVCRLPEWDRNDERRRHSCCLLISSAFTASDCRKLSPHRAAAGVTAVKVVRCTARVHGYSNNSFPFPSEKLLAINCHLSVLREQKCYVCIVSVSATSQRFTCSEEEGGCSS